MPFIGHDTINDKRVNILNYEDPRAIFKRGQIVCRYCKEELVIRGNSRISVPKIHFMHLSNECKGEYKHHPESPEHLFFKELLSRDLAKDLDEYSNARVELECPVESIKRIIDVAFIFPNGWVVAHEVQLSAITPNELEERTNDYRKAGIDVTWWLGKQANTQKNRQWCYEKLGECHTIDYEKLVEHSAK
ncbi:hypothetical protein C4C99_RS21540 [Vibrio parahaemolyticus]|jgi:competence CoiA-like predicted nuclease|uniref:Competence protein CoiA family protein n=4 Tax=Vibrio TaxID=662 RepID=A0ABV5HSM4_9VIBR|nr:MULTISPECIES: competence protein CoiA family protein [Vibrio]MBY7929092.1 hypothetical protein [Vibrio fluvialis]EGQ7957402.1 hypothetical protein [Vibrio vulnificus]EGQ7988521.1 hypothetical protein [Vibrio vulnificus]EGQ8132443.1 hypothetical protein [Vibrio parahaemolyticus]EGQ8282088.1 hypothetical protein [Vibrio parahaemolyticus]